MVSGQERRSSLWLPYWPMYLLAWLCELLRVPLLSRAEVNKVARTHFWKTERARTLLRYGPVVSRREGLRRMYAHFEAELLRQNYPLRYQQFRSRVVFALVVVFIFFLLQIIH